PNRYCFSVFTSGLEYRDRQAGLAATGLCPARAVLHEWQMLATGSGGDVMSHDPPKRTFSIELFPPRTPKGEAGLNSALTELGELQPAYFSVTFGAGGTTRSGTYETVRTAATVTGRPVAPHLSCIEGTKESIGAMLDQYAEAGHKRIVALRGDL